MLVQLLLFVLIQTPSVETAPNPLELLYEDAMVAMEAREWDEAIFETRGGSGGGSIPRRFPL